MHQLHSIEHPSRAPSRFSRTALAVLVACAFMAACSRTPESTPAASGAKGAASEPAGQAVETAQKLDAEEIKRSGITVEELKAQANADLVTVTATIKANQDRVARIAPRVEGRIVSVSANLGDKVSAGQALATLDSVSLGEAQAALREAQSNHRIAQADFERAQGLVTQEIIPQRDYLRAKGDFEKATSALRAAQDKLRLLGASPIGADGGATFQLRSPLAGTVIAKDATVGELASSSTQLFTVADLSKLWIEANLTEDMLARVHPGAAAAVTVGAWPGERFAGKVTYIAGVLDKDTQAVPARIEVENKDGRLKPEMFATASIETGKAGAPALSVPDGAIVLLQGQPTVFLQEHGGFEPRPVETGARLGGRTVVKSGLQAGDQVVVAGTYALKARLLKSQISED